ncbi:MAG: apolipoprotein N-acyltransferase [Bacteroidia bacterium]
MHKFKYTLHALIGGILLSLSWYFDLTALIFVAFTPLLFIEDYFSNSNDLPKRKLKFYLLTYICFLIWNLGVTWWVYCVQFGKEGALAAFLANSLLMMMVFSLFSAIKKRINKSWGIWLLVPIWIAWEYCHMNWDLTWPWLTLGNVFAYKTNWVQWYEYSGFSGGSLWILSVNILVFRILKAKSFQIKSFAKPIIAIAVPILLSYIILFSYRNNSQLSKQNILIVQPNIDPYNEKFDAGFDTQFNEALSQIRGKINGNTDLLVLPETFVPININEDDLSESEEIKLFYDSLINKYPDLSIITGINSYKFYTNPSEVTPTARYHDGYNLHYDVFNTALFISKEKTELYHKSKLVPGVELMPFPWLMKPFESLALDLGGTTGSLGVQKNRSVFKTSNNTVYAPVICYESVYGEFCREYIKNGANFITIITNDGWWDNTPGHKQHLNYARLRAIETRRSILRSANTGISAVINEKGEITDRTTWWNKALIEIDIQGNNEKTLYVVTGDLIAKIALAISLISLIINWYLRFFKR